MVMMSRFLSVDSDGNLNVDELMDSIRPDTLLVTLMAANNGRQG